MLNKTIATNYVKKEELKIIIGYLLNHKFSPSNIHGVNSLLDHYNSAQFNKIIEKAGQIIYQNNPKSKELFCFKLLEKILSAIQETVERNDLNKQTVSTLQEINKLTKRIFLELDLSKNSVIFYFDNTKIFIKKSSMHYINSYYIREELRKEILNNLEILYNKKHHYELLPKISNIYGTLVCRLQDLRSDNNLLLSNAAAFIAKKRPDLNNNIVNISKDNGEEIILEIKKDDLSSTVWPLQFFVNLNQQTSLPEITPSVASADFLN